MTRTFVQRGALMLAAVVGLIGTAPRSASAQKALVYCPVSVDATGCTTIVNALTGPMFPLGVDKGYDGTNGTVDLKAVDLFSYSVFVVPSLADGSSSQPYAKLRDPEVQEHLKAALIGRIAMWSGTPDQGATNRAMKDALIQNLAGWAAGAYATAKGPGLVALLDASASVVTRYDWARAIAPLPVTSDANLLIYNSVRSLNQRATSILTSGAGAIVYDNMATFGFQVPNGAAGVSLDAVGQTGSSQGGQVVLLTMEAGNSSGATVKTDKDDYPPGTTVVITGTGWEPGETVKLTLHHDPMRDDDTELSAVADANGDITNTDFAPADYDLFVRFVLTAIGQTSGRRAQATFTDAVSLKTLSATPGSLSVVAGTSAVYDVSLEFNGNGTIGCIATLAVTGLPAGTAASWSPSNTISATSGITDSRTLTITTSSPSPATTITVSATAPGGGGQGCSGGTLTTSVGLTITAPANAPPILGAIGNKNVDETTLLQFTATATDAPGQTLTYSLDAGSPAGATINASTGQFNWTPTESQGGSTYPVTIRVTDNGSPALNDFETINITVNEVNVAPVLDAIGAKNVNELATLAFNATASDTDIPANSLTFSLAAGTDPVPAGAGITAGGAFSWTPTEAQGPGVYKFKVVVTDNGSPNLFDEEEITVTVAELNVAPMLLNVPASATIPEGALYSFDANATDTDTPAQTLTFSLESEPAGATIDPSTGVFSWTPAEAQAPNAYTFKVKVSDGTATTESSITVTVTEVNVAPVLGAIGDKAVDELATLSFTASAMDADLPANGLTYFLINAPAGASINPTSGAFSWSPTEAQGPGSYTFTVKVTDDGSPNLSDEEEITVTVNEVNVLPTLTGVPATATIPEKAPYTFDADATDPDLPAQTLTFSLVGGPSGASINPSSGVFLWTPTEAQGPGDYTFKVRVTDGTGNTESSITITVNEVNEAPVLASIGDRTIDELTALDFTASASDPDLPANTLTYSLVGAPAGASINSTTGAFTWTPTEAQGPGTYTFTVKVADDGSPSLFDDETITVTVNEVNADPVLNSIGSKTIDEKTLLTFTASATDSDIPTNTLTFSLVAGADAVPSGAAIDPSSGVFTWTPGEDQGPKVYKFKVRVTDNGVPAKYDEEEITFTVNEVNEAPILAAIGNKNVDEETLLTFTASAADADLPANTLTYSLVGAPAGAAINSGTGVFNWTPTEAQGPGSYTFTVKVTDNGTPAASDEESITVTVAEVNKAPTVATIPAKLVNEGATLAFTASATDPDDPANTLTFSLVSPPAGAAINPTTGEFSWTPADGPASVNITVHVTDNGSPALSDDETFAVTVNNVSPTATFSAPTGPINEGQPIALSFSSPVDVAADIPGILYAFDCGTGTGYGVPAATATATCSAQDDPNQIVKGKVIDKDGGSTEYARTVYVDNVAPVLGAITISPNAVVQVNTTITASASFTDAGVKDTHTGTFAWDDATANTDAGITELNGSGTASATHKYTSPGVYEVVLTLRDKDGAEVGQTFQYVVVYDPNGGFVTGGGWIDSPLNACQLTVACKSLTGKANFGFVSKYKKGQSTPEGNTEFQFKAGNINFHSEVYDWLVVASSRAQFKGTGTINGSGSYGFMLTAIDGQVTGGGGVDKFRIKIWDKNDGDRIVYDNQLTASDDATLTTVLGGGSINIQTK